MRRLLFFVVAGLAASVGGLVFACGSSDGGAPDAGSVPVACEGSTCDGGAPESSVTDAPADDGARADVSVDAAGDTSPDAGPCVLPAPDPDAGPSGTLQWAKNFGTTGFTYPAAIARDPSNGDVVVTGYFWGTTDFGGGPLTSQAPTDGSGSDMFGARFDRNGVYKWAGVWGNGSNFGANAVAVGPKGEMVFGGTIRGGSIDFGNGCDALTSTGSPDTFLVQFDKAGACTWSKRFGAAGQTQNINNLAIDPAGNIVFAGASSGGLDFGGGPLAGLVLAKLTTTGAHAWSKSFTAVTSYGGPWVALDPFGNAILGGNSHSPSIDLGGGPRTSPNGNGGPQESAAFVAKFDPSGGHLWSRRFAHFTTISGPSPADACGNILLHGAFSATVDLGSGPIIAAPAAIHHGYLAKFDTAGAAKWTKSFDGFNRNASPNGYVSWSGVVADQWGGPTIMPVLAGSVSFGNQETVDFGGGPLTNAGEASAALASFDATGKHRWSYVAGAPSTARISARAESVALAAWGASIVSTGIFNKCATVCTTAPPGTTLVLAGKTLTAVSGQDFFIASFTP